MQKITKKLGRTTISVGENLYGNWYGYIGRTRVEMFFGDTYEQAYKAKQWLEDVALTYPRLPRQA